MARDGFMVSRAIFDHDLFRQKREYSRLEAWLWLIAEAAWKPRRVNVSGRTVTLERGQLCHSVRFMAEAWGWSKSATDRYLSRLKTETMIGTDSGTGQLVITICNYDDYQLTPEYQRDSSGTPAGTAAGQQRDSSGTNENQGNQEIRESIDSSSLRSLGERVDPDDVQLAFDDWNTLAAHSGLPKATSLTTKRRAALKQRLKECGGRVGWQNALRMIPSSPFLMGENNTGFTATLDFVLQASSFTKLREGNYARRGNGPAPQLKGLALVKEQLRQEIENAGRGSEEGAGHPAVQQLALNVGRR